ncbi:MAG: hypothetical protein JWN83_2040 [Chitinophagaceae bacterium]|nr:hypothetical protein [Chitinophagaceae bacterium]
MTPIISLYRAMSGDEFEDCQRHAIFRISTNTLEAKEFFKSYIGCISGF